MITKARKKAKRDKYVLRAIFIVMLIIGLAQAYIHRVSGTYISPEDFRKHVSSYRDEQKVANVGNILSDLYDQFVSRDVIVATLQPSDTDLAKLDGNDPETIFRELEPYLRRKFDSPVNSCRGASLTDLSMHEKIRDAKSNPHFSGVVAGFADKFSKEATKNIEIYEEIKYFEFLSSPLTGPRLLPYKSHKHLSEWLEIKEGGFDAGLVRENVRMELGRILNSEKFACIANECGLLLRVSDTAKLCVGYVLWRSPSIFDGVYTEVWKGLSDFDETIALEYQAKYKDYRWLISEFD